MTTTAARRVPDPSRRTLSTLMLHTSVLALLALFAGGCAQVTGEEQETNGSAAAAEQAVNAGAPEQHLGDTNDGSSRVTGLNVSEQLENPAAADPAAPWDTDGFGSAGGDASSFRDALAEAIRSERNLDVARRRMAPALRRGFNANRLASSPPPAPRTVAALASDLGGILDNSVRSGRWGVMVVSLTRGDTLFSREADEPFLPASTMKLFTAALALEQFGAQHTFSTQVLRDGALAPGGVVHGDLILRGGGDPAFSRRYIPGEDANAPMVMLAHFVRGAGVTRVTGDLIADATAFEERRIPEGWLARYLHDRYAARVSALSINENILSVVVRGSEAGEPASVALDPASSTHSVVNSVRTVAGSGSSVIIRRTSDTTFEARGTIGIRAGMRRYDLVVEDPALLAAGAFHEALRAQGIEVQGQVRMGQTPARAVPVTAFPSPPLSRLVSVMNRESTNHFAELIFRNSARGVEGYGDGSATVGNELLHNFLVEKVGIDSGAVYAADGSGLSTLDRATPRALLQLLSYAHTAPWGSVFHASMPVAGESELLRTRMRLTPAQGNLHGKTGTTNSVISLGGYVTAESGELLAFVFLYNGTDRWNARDAIDEMGVTLASFLRG
jgi:serine-type D-Ala-D-Ala carboxypeptidase/endopeptidase (penicillin-binding protein 4)